MVSIENVLLQHGWTADDLAFLAKPEVATYLLSEIRKKHAFEKAMRNAAIFEKHGNRLLEEIFTEDLTFDLGFTVGMRMRFLDAMANYHPTPGGMPEPIKTVQQLHSLGRALLRHIPKISRSTVHYVEAVLKTIDIPFN